MSDQLMQAILDWNPWLEGDFPESLYGIERDQQLLPLLDLPEIKILEGARRVGKSTLFYQLISHLLDKGKKVLYVNFDDEQLSTFSLKEIYYTYTKHREVDFLFLDEIQNCENWVHFVRKLYDTTPEVNIWISGSNSALIKQEYKTLLSGRNISLTIYPLSFLEFLKFNELTEVKLPLSSQKESKVIGLFEHYLSWGAFPVIAKRKFYHKELLINYFEDIIYKDIVNRYDVDVGKVKDLAVYLATNSAKNFSYRSVANALNLHPKTVTEYLSYFKEVFLFSECYRFDYSLKQQLTRDKKVYIIDVGLAAANAFRFSQDKGRMMENLVYCELKRHNKDVYFHKQKKECDFVIKSGIKVIDAIQVSYSLEDDATKDREIAGLLDAMTYFKLNSGLILTMYEEDQFELKVDGKVYVVHIKPIWKWMLN